MDTNIPESAQERQAFWRGHIEAWQSSGLAQREYARQHNLPLARFTYWKGKLAPAKPGVSSGFVRVNVVPELPVRLQHRCGWMIECSTGTDPAWLRAVLGLADAS